MFCPNCGKSISDDAKFCINCGASISQNASTQQAPVQQTAETQSAADKVFEATEQKQTHQAAQDKTNQPSAANGEKTKTTAALIAFFVGSLGIMDFYAGNTKRGIIKLVLSLTCIGAIAAAVMNVLDMFKIANEKYVDVNGKPFAGPNNVAKPLAIVAAVTNGFSILSAVIAIIVLIVAAATATSSVNNYASNYTSNTLAQAVAAQTVANQAVAAQVVETAQRVVQDENYNTFRDSRDGKVYRYIKVNGTDWMAENLNFRTGSSHCYNDNQSNCSSYGRLYNWFEARRICPSGWRLPSKYEWEQFERALKRMGATDRTSKSDFLRARSWYYGEDRIGFSAIPSGTRFKGGYYGAPGTQKESAHYWSSSEYNSDTAYDWFIYADGQGAGLYGKNDKIEREYSVRCIR